MKLHKKTQIEVQKLLDETGYALQLDDLSDIIELNDLAKRVTGPDGAYDDIYNWPIKCANLLLRPLSLGKLSWYNNRALAWFDDDTETLSTVLAFLMSIENTEQAIWDLSSPEQAKEAIETWEQTVEASPVQLAYAVDKVIGKRTSSTQKGDLADNYGPMISLLCREYGETPRYWMYEADLAVINAMMADYTNRLNQQMKQNQKISKGKTANRQAQKPIVTPSMEATLQFRKKLLELKEKWGAGHGS